MKKPVAPLSLSAWAATAALLLTAAPASAAPSTVWTVTPSPVAVSATNVGNVGMNLNGLPMNCPKSTASMLLASTTGNPAVLGNVSALTFGAPGAPCSSQVPLVVTPTGPWKFVARDHDATTGVTSGYVDDIDIGLNVAYLVLRVRGRSSATFSNATGRLTLSSVTGELPVTQTNDAGAVPVGSSLFLKATYQTRVSGSSLLPKIVGTNP
ncbi:hypothetical protein ACIQCR_21895 [Streptomyces sp. NPDC093249]|uniref:hypothetical protein n=1 Tax=unclassified Streptomyces TaxID=2593676 RepID=UPI00381B6183